MEAAEPVSYEFPGHPVGAVASRRMMNSNLSHHGYSFYGNPAASYSLPFQSTSPSSATYSFGHILNNHPTPYQHFFVAGQQPPVHHQPVRLSSEPPQLQALPDIRPAKNAVYRVTREPLTLTKVEPEAASPTPLIPPIPPSTRESAHAKNPNSAEIEFSTEVDILMKAIQSRIGSPPTASQSLPSLQQLTSGHSDGYSPTFSVDSPEGRSPAAAEEQSPPKEKKQRKYNCTLPHCGKTFSQKTHLDIHMRAHTGEKPFVCKEPSCGQRFSQLGNLKTHQRRHTGERPYSCDICHKKFAQRGNVRAHKIVHQDAKPFTCLLDDCRKQFSQLGNLKSHQNKFHAATLQHLTMKFSTLEGGPMTPQDRELWEYFATLYKNSNKGIKGRGKDRRIAVKSDRSNDARRVDLHLLGSDEDVKPPRGSYEDSSYTGGSSSDEEDAEGYYMVRRNQ